MNIICQLNVIKLYKKILQLVDIFQAYLGRIQAAEQIGRFFFYLKGTLHFNINLGSNISLDPHQYQVYIKNSKFNHVQTKNPQTFSAKKPFSA